MLDGSATPGRSGPCRPRVCRRFRSGPEHRHSPCCAGRGFAPSGSSRRFRAVIATGRLSDVAGDTVCPAHRPVGPVGGLSEKFDARAEAVGLSRPAPQGRGRPAGPVDRHPRQAAPRGNEVRPDRPQAPPLRSRPHRARPLRHPPAHRARQPPGGLRVADHGRPRLRRMSGPPPGVPAPVTRATGAAPVGRCASARTRSGRCGRRQPRTVSVWPAHG